MTTLDSLYIHKPLHSVGNFGTDSAVHAAFFQLRSMKDGVMLPHAPSLLSIKPLPAKLDPQWPNSLETLAFELKLKHGLYRPQQLSPLPAPLLPLSTRLPTTLCIHILDIHEPLHLSGISAVDTIIHASSSHQLSYDPEWSKLPRTRVLGSNKISKTISPPSPL